MVSPIDPALGGNVHNGDPFSYAPRAWEYLIRRFAVRSVLDLGCGQGHAARYMSNVLGCDVIAVDGLEENLLESVHPIVIHDIRTAPFRSRVDLVYSVELVEHIEEQYLDNLLRSLTAGKILAMTHAIPGQDGHHHVNCQTDVYWCDHLGALGFSLMEEDTNRIREIGTLDGAAHIAKSGLIFGRI
jgi:SAM-dependent methyltransferase